MNESRFKIVFDGTLLPGFELESTKNNVAKLFMVERSAVERLFNGQRLILKRQLNETDANLHLASLQQAGANAQIEPEQPISDSNAAAPAPVATLVPCPNCGFRQHAAFNCTVCGTRLQTADSTTANSPFAPPRSALESSNGEFSTLKVWTLEGRIGRVRYLGWSMASVLISELFTGVITLLMAGVFFAVPGRPAYVFVIVIGFILGFILRVVLWAPIGVKRLHDMNWSGWCLFIMMIPLVNFIFGLLMLFMPGTERRNDYGPPPPPNTAGVVVLAWCWVIAPIVLVGILAAVAIPAYQNYTQKAQHSAAHR